MGTHQLVDSTVVGGSDIVRNIEFRFDFIGSGCDGSGCGYSVLSNCIFEIVAIDVPFLQMFNVLQKKRGEMDCSDGDRNMLWRSFG